MSLELDRRQRAMLQEMGVHVWLPQAAAAAQPLAPNVDGARSHSNAAAPKAAAASPAAGIAEMDWPMLAGTVAGCQACPLSKGRSAPVFPKADAVQQADWLVLGEPPDEEEERCGASFAGQSGQLLDNMLRAVGVARHDANTDRATAAYVSNCVKCRCAPARNPTMSEIAMCEHYLRREVALVQPKVILAMGRFAANTVLQQSLSGVASTPLGKLRGQIHHYRGVPVVVTYHPSYLLRTQPDKARAWADLCLALELLGRLAKGSV